MTAAILLAAVCLAGAGTAPVALDHGAAVQSRLVSVSVSRAGCADRIVFRFAKLAPGYRVGYEPAARAKTEDASGRRLRIAGSAFLVVRFSDTVTAAEPRRVSFHGHHVREAVRTGAFEAVVTWAVGLDAKRPFRVRVSGSTIVVSVG